MTETSSHLVPVDARPMSTLEALGLLRSALFERPIALGDAAIIKGVLLNFRGPDAVLDELVALHQKDQALPDVSTERIAACPPGSLGAHFSAFMKANKLSPMNASSRLRQRLTRAELFSARYVATHDLVHVVLGFDTSWAGEAAVYAFMHTLMPTPVFRFAHFMARKVVPVVVPWRSADVRRVCVKAVALAQTAHPRFISHAALTALEKPLDDVREELGVSAAGH